jgi:hypothetical protein
MYEVQGKEDAQAMCVAGIPRKTGPTAPASARFHLPFRILLEESLRNNEFFIDASVCTITVICAKCSFLDTVGALQLWPQCCVYMS